MKKTKLIITAVTLGVFLIHSCSEEKSGISPKLIPEKIEVVTKDNLKDKVVKLDDVAPERSKPIPPPPPKPPIPEPGPEPHPGPWPDPRPWPDPEPPRPEPIPDPVNEFPEVEAEYPGGTEALLKFMRDNVKYPEIDKELGNQGRVYLRFVIEMDGSITSIEVKKGVSETIDREAKRVIRSMPKWKPAEDKGKVVRSKVTVPMIFSLQ